MVFLLHLHQNLPDMHDWWKLPETAETSQSQLPTMQQKVVFTWSHLHTAA